MPGRRKPGRKPTGRRREAYLKILLTDGEKRALADGARKAGLDVSTWLRQLGLRAVGFLDG